MIARHDRHVSPHLRRIRYRDFHVIIEFSRTVYFGGSGADGFMQRHIVDVVTRAVRIVRIVVVRLVHSRRLAVEERRQFLEQTKGFFFTYEPVERRGTKIRDADVRARAESSRLADLFAHACNDSSFRGRYLIIRRVSQERDRQEVYTIIDSL